MSADVHLCKRTYVSHAHNLHSEVPQKVNDLQRFASQEKDEDEGRDDGTEQLFQYKNL